MGTIPASGSNVKIGLGIRTLYLGNSSLIIFKCDW